MFPQIALSEHEKEQKIWVEGDIIATKILCETEDAILELINADIKGPESYVLMVAGTLVADGQCIALPFPIRFKVIKSLLEYEDFKKIPSVVLGVVSQNGDWVGWILAAGTFQENEKKYVSI